MKEIFTDEVMENLCKLQGSAAGIHGLSVEYLESKPFRFLVAYLDFLLAPFHLPALHCVRRTCLIPKKAEPKEPGDFRPICVSNMIVRLSHRILASRWEA